MNYKKSMIIIMLAVFLFSIAAASASDLNDTAIARGDDSQIELSASDEITVDNLQTNENNDTLTQANNDETASVKTDSEILTADQATYNDLRNDIGPGGNINLNRSYYRYNSSDGDNTIEIINPGVINGNGAVIDMAGSAIRAFNVVVSGVTIKNLTIKNANFNGDGGAIYFSKSGTVENCNFTDNQATGAGGAIYFYLSTGTVTNCNFTNNKAVGSYYSGGGAIYIYSGNVTNCNFKDNSAKRGGAIYASSSKSNVTNCNFTGNSAKYGGAIYGGTAGLCILKTSSDTVYYTDAQPTFTVSKNILRFDSGDKLLFNITYDNKNYDGYNTTITLTKDGNPVGVYYVLSGSDEGWSVELSPGIYHATLSTEHYTVKPKTVTIITGTNVNTYSELAREIGSGGGYIELQHDYYIYDNGSSIEINASNTVIDGDGAVIDMAGSDIRAFTVNASKVTIKNLTVKNVNYDDGGGAIYFSLSGSVTNCNFIDNQASYGGGAICMNYGSVENCNFDDNTANYGGAVYFIGDGIVTNCNFTNNTSIRYGDGGAIYFNSNSRGTVTKCNFIDNQASYGGGAISMNYGSVENCNFTNNTADKEGGAICFSSNGEGSVTNCNFMGNNASEGSAIYFYGYVWIPVQVTDPDSGLTSWDYLRVPSSNTVSNSRFLNNRANAEDLRVTKNDNNLIIIFTGNDNLLNAIYSADDGKVTFTNVTYWGAKGVTDTGSSTINPSKSNNEEGQNITVEIYDSNDNLVDNVTLVTDGNGQVTYDLIKLSNGNYTYKAYHSEDCYYTYAEITDDFTVDIGDFNRLQSYINGADANTTLTLYRNYTFTTGLDENLVDGIVIDKPITINGNGYTIDALQKARIFNVTVSSINITGLTFKNGRASTAGGAIYFENTISNSNINARFINNTATWGGANFFRNSVSGLNVTGTYANNTAGERGGANFFRNSVSGLNVTGTYANNKARYGGANNFDHTVSNSTISGTYINNNATVGGANYFYSVSNSTISGTYINNNATVGGANYFFMDVSGSIISGTYINNNATDGGAVYFLKLGTVENCNFTANNATTGSAIYFSLTSTVYNSCFLNNRANTEALEVTKNDNNITITFAGKDNLLNAIYSKGDVSFTNVTYWGASGITNTGSSAIKPSRSKNEAGQNITLEIYDSNNQLVDNVTLVTDGNGQVTYDLIKLSNGNYTYKAYHSEDCYYTYAEKTGKFTLDIGDFNRLQRYINGAEENSVLTLYRNYTFTTGLDENLVDGIVIDKPLTINGNGYTIDALQKARIFYVTVSSINITGLTFKNGRADTGGAIYFKNTISNSNINARFINNTATDGGANYFYSSVSGLNVTGTYANNTAGERGGANFFKNSVSNSTIGGTYSNNNATWYGGANYFNRTVSNSTISGTYINNNATVSGGANYFERTVSNSTISGTYINNNATWGGANYFERTVSNSTISGTYTNNNASYGGANFFWGSVLGSNVTGTYSNNNAMRGGANYFSGVSNSTIVGKYTNNTATSSGGANFFFEDVSGSIITGTYTYNTATVSGGANYFERTVSNSTISGTYTNNTATVSGGANYFERTVSNSTISGTYTNNNATVGGANYFWSSVSGSNVTGTYSNNNATVGGANFFEDVSASFITGTYSNNNATVGGANFFEDVSGSIITGTYSNNNATVGGANYFFMDVSGSIITGTYSNNNATWGGANYFYRSVSNSTIGGTYINNTAAESIIYFQDKNDEGLDAQINNAIFLNNNCTYEIYTSKQGIVVKDSWFGNNASNFMNKPNVNENVTIDNWLFLNATVDFNSLLILDSSNITFKLNSTNGTDVFVFDNSKLPIVNLTLTATNGDVEKTTTLDNIVKYTATEKGKGSVTAKVENAQYTIYFDNIPINVDLSASAKNITYLENETLTLTYNNTATGKVNITLKSKNYNKTIERDINQSVTIADLPAGEYDVTIEYFGDNVFSNATAYANFTVKKITTQVTLDNETIDLFVDNESKITYTLKPENASGNISFSSDDSSIVSVNSTSGNITAKGEGSANITVSFSGNENYTASNATITVNVKKIPTQITVNSSHIDMKVNGEADIGASLEPANAGNLTYKSSDENIVKVEGGKIIALKEGNATITVSFKGDNKYATAENKTINVTVSLNDASVSVNNNTLDLLIDGAFTIVATTTPEDLNVSYVPDDSGVYSIDENGNVIGLREGEGSIIVKVGGNGVYAKNSTTVNVTVSKIPTEITVLNDTIVLTVGDEIDTGATLTPPDAGNLTYSISNSSVVKVVDGKIIALAEGESTITVSFEGDKKYLEAENKTINVTVSKVPTEITVNPASLDLFVGDETVIVANLTPADAGNVTFTSSNESLVIVDDEGNVIANGEGQAIITVSFAGDNKYAASQNRTITVDVSLNDASVTVDSDTLDLKVDETYQINATRNPDTILLEITYKSSDNSVVAVDENGIVTAVGAGTAIITLSVGDGEIYAVNSTTINVTVNKINSSLCVDDVVLDYGETTKVNVTFDGALGITAELDGEEIIFSGNSVPIPVLNAGTHNLTVTTIPDNNHVSVNKTVTVTVLKINTTEDIGMLTNVTAGENSTVSVKLPTDATGNVSLSVDGNEVMVVPVADGNADITLPSLSAGNHTVEISYSGDGNYNPVEKTTVITVDKKTSKLTATKVTTTFNVKKYLVITLIDGENNPLSGVQVEVTIKGTKNFTTDKNGQIKISTRSLAPKTYATKISFKGNENCTGSDLSTKIVIKKGNSKITAKTKSFDDTDKYKRYTVTLKDNVGAAIKNVWVALKVGGRIYLAKTNNNGQATFYLTGLTKTGTFKASLYFAGSKYYNKVSTKTTISVKSTFKTVSKGSTDTATVVKIQRALKNNGYYITYDGYDLVVDGVYGDCTERSVQEFQAAKGLKVTGKVDYKTAQELKIVK